jgi:hypothetical protein
LETIMNLLPAAIRIFSVGALLCAAAASAADRRSEAEAQYQKHRALCLSGQLNQDRATCLRDAGAGLQAVRRGNADNPSTDYERNRLARCDLQPAEDRGLCIRRVNGEGIVRGSVDGGGFYQELRVTVPDTAAGGSTSSR